jgi:peptide/nickel transport system permease protein
MAAYIVRRLLLFIPTLFAISLLAFIISVNAPGDPALNSVTEKAGSRMPQNAIKQQRTRLGLDLPLFYFSLGSLSDLPNSQAFYPAEVRSVFERLSNKYGNPTAVMNYYAAIQDQLSTDGRAQSLLYTENAAEIQKIIGETKNPALATAWLRVQDSSRPWRSYIPAISWHGLHNQYHRWLTRALLHGDLGRSYTDSRPVVQKLAERLPWSIVLAMLSIILAYIISIPAGVFAATHEQSAANRLITLLIFVLYSIPVFFAGTLLLTFFANPDFFEWFPTGGIGDPALYNQHWSFFTKISFWAPYLVLPVITYTYGAIAFLSRQVKAGMTEALSQEYIKTARAKGLPERKIIWRHAFRNVLLPIITVFSGVFPLAIGGSVIIETLFSIPGMGLQIYQSILQSDYPMIVGIFTVYGLVTLMAYLIADVLYAVADPRVEM